MSKVGNTVTFIGRLTKDVELKTVGDTYVCNFCLARTRDFKRKDEEHPESDFVDCVAWGKTAELLSKYFHKGNRVGVSGSLQTRTYENQNGFKVKVTEVFVEQVEFIERKTDSTATENTAVSEPTPPSNNNSNEDSVYTDDDDMPF